MSKGILIRVLALGLVLALMPALASAKKNDNAVFVIDWDGDPTDTSFTTDTTVSAGSEIEGYVILKDAVDLIAVNCDLSFDTSKLQLVWIEETVADLNFDSKASLSDLGIFASVYQKSEGDEGWEPYYDRNNDGTISLSDLGIFASGYQNEGPFWTVYKDSGPTYQESVEIYDPVATSNANGKIDDIVAVLLQRPDEASFAYTGNAVIAKVRFKALSGASGTVNLTFSDTAAVGSGEDVTDPAAPTGTTTTITIQ